jgi:DNA-directed RNA polymerase subunit RPC12/RpoP
MWIKYSYICTDCDALIEITSLQKFTVFDGQCPCGARALVRVAVEDGRVKEKRVKKVTLP